jgi:hypothetical protein
MFYLLLVSDLPGFYHYLVIHNTYSAGTRYWCFSCTYFYLPKICDISSTYSKCCGNLQADHHSQPLPSYFLNLFIPLYRSLMFSFLQLVASSLILSFRYTFFLSLKCLTESCLTLFRLSPFILYGFCSHCNLSYFL